MVVVTGGVKSRIARTERVLPEGSLYVDIEEHFERRVRHSQEGAMDTMVYTRGVVREALKTRGWWGGQKKQVWRGNRVGDIWVVWNVVGSWLFDIMLPRMFGLNKLAKIVRGRK